MPSDGGWSGTVADLNDDGYDDVVIGMTNNGERSDLNAFVYYGSSDGFSERRRQLLPAPHSVSITAGDFNGDGRMDLAFLCSASRPHSDHFVRIFYQSDLGFESQRFVDTSIRGDQLSAGDLDGDGHTDLVVRSRDGDVRVFWGGPDGIDPSRSDLLPVRAGHDRPCRPRSSTRRSCTPSTTRTRGPLVQGRGPERYAACLRGPAPNGLAGAGGVRPEFRSAYRVRLPSGYVRGRR